MLCQWDPHSIPILSEVAGKARLEDVVEGETMRSEKDPSGHVRRTIMDHKGELHPQIVLEDADGKPLDVYYLPEKAFIEVDEGEEVAADRYSPRRLVKQPAYRTSLAVYRVSRKFSKHVSRKILL